MAITHVNFTIVCCTLTTLMRLLLKSIPYKMRTNRNITIRKYNTRVIIIFLNSNNGLSVMLYSPPNNYSFLSFFLIICKCVYNRATRDVSGSSDPRSESWIGPSYLHSTFYWIRMRGRNHTHRGPPNATFGFTVFQKIF